MAANPEPPALAGYDDHLQTLEQPVRSQMLNGRFFSVEQTVIDEIRLLGDHLLRAHVQEVEPDLAPGLDPNWGFYRDVEELGNLIVLAARDSTDELVGYAIAFCFESFHYRGRILCQHDALYVLPEWRGLGVGRRLVNDLRSEARDRGASRLLMVAKHGGALESLLPRLGFRTEETVFMVNLCP